ncbi:hypothetical protein [Elizabethkingia phage TCUEAP1]|nr:hypothetical protein [Elizabethkingia phage TCUEAP1]
MNLISNLQQLLKNFPNAEMIETKVFTANYNNVRNARTCEIKSAGITIALFIEDSEGNIQYVEIPRRDKINKALTLDLRLLSLNFSY